MVVGLLWTVVVYDLPTDAVRRQSICRVYVTVEPSAFARGLQDVDLNDLGLEATFDCEVSKSDLKAEWFKGDKPIKRSEKYNITSKNGQHSLTISDCQVDDVASYTIKLDGISSSAKLAIKGNRTLNF